MAQSRFRLEAEGCSEELQRDLDQCIRYSAFAQVKATIEQPQISARSLSKSVSDDEEVGNVSTSYEAIKRRLQQHQYDAVRGIEAFANF